MLLFNQNIQGRTCSGSNPTRHGNLLRKGADLATMLYPSIDKLLEKVLPNTAWIILAKANDHIDLQVYQNPQLRQV